MREYRVLIVEDDPMFSLHLEEIIECALSAEIILATTVGSARTVLTQPFDVAFLDVEVLDGRTYGLASDLIAADVPIAFVSASNRAEMPAALGSVPFIVKPCTEADVRRFLASCGIGHERFARRSTGNGFELGG